MPSRCGAARNGPCRVGSAPLRRAGAPRFVIPSKHTHDASSHARGFWRHARRPCGAAHITHRVEAAGDGRRAASRGGRCRVRLPQREERRGVARVNSPHVSAELSAATQQPAPRARNKAGRAADGGRSREGGRHGRRLDGRRPAPARISIRARARAWQGRAFRSHSLSGKGRAFPAHSLSGNALRVAGATGRRCQRRGRSVAWRGVAWRGADAAWHGRGRARIVLHS